MEKIIDYYRKLFRTFSDASQIPRLMVFYGEENYLMERAVDRISETLSHPVSYIDASEKNFVELFEKETHVGLFAPKKVLVIKRAHKIKSANEFFSMMYKTEHRVILIYEDRKKAVSLKRSLKNVEFIEFPEMDVISFEIWIKSKLKQENKKISKETLRKLSAKLPKDLTSAQQELQKLILYLEERKVIDEEDLDVIFEEEPADFKGLLRRIFSEADERSLKEYVLLRERGFSPHAFIAEAEQFLTALYLIKEDMNEIARRKSRMRSSSKMREISSRFSARDILNLLDRVVEMDAYTKSVSFDRKVILNLLFVDLLQNA